MAKLKIATVILLAALTPALWPVLIEPWDTTLVGLFAASEILLPVFWVFGLESRGVLLRLASG
jgi:hypothetical protein